LTAEGGREPAAHARGARRSGRQVCEVVDNRRDVLRVDWRLVRIPHLLDLGLPDGAGQARLRQNHAGGMASQTVVVDDIGPRAGKSAVAVRVLLPLMLEGNPDAPLIVERVYYTRDDDA
jgi:hypothetical protein